MKWLVSTFINLVVWLASYAHRFSVLLVGGMSIAGGIGLTGGNPTALVYFWIAAKTYAWLVAFTFAFSLTLDYGMYGTGGRNLLGHIGRRGSWFVVCEAWYSIWWPFKWLNIEDSLHIARRGGFPEAVRTVLTFWLTGGWRFAFAPAEIIPWSEEDRLP